MFTFYKLSIESALYNSFYLCIFFRKFYVELCRGKLSHSIPHPTRNDELLLLLFDFIHNIKNIFNAFINQSQMNVPTAGYEYILGKSCKASFAHVKQLYALEEHKTLKIAHTLKKSSLNHSSIARTSPLHALSK